MVYPDDNTGDNSSFEIDMALGMLGLNDQDKQTVEAAIPPGTEVMNAVNANMPQIMALYNTFQPLVGRDLPKVVEAVTIVMNALNRKVSAKQQQRS